jgi:hypothetical protein
MFTLEQALGHHTLKNKGDQTLGQLHLPPKQWSGINDQTNNQSKNRDHLCESLRWLMSGSIELRQSYARPWKACARVLAPKCRHRKVERYGT